MVNLKQRDIDIICRKKKMFDSVKDKMEEYYDYISDTNSTIESGINAMKNIFSGIMEKYRK